MLNHSGHSQGPGTEESPWGMGLQANRAGGASATQSLSTLLRGSWETRGRPDPFPQFPQTHGLWRAVSTLLHVSPGWIQESGTG